MRQMGSTARWTVLSNIPKAQAGRHLEVQGSHGKRIDAAGVLKLKETSRHLETLWTGSPVSVSRCVLPRPGGTSARMVEAMMACPQWDADGC